MDLNKLQLSSITISELYKKSLVETATLPLKNNEPAKTGKNYLGENGKNILFVVNYPDISIISNDHLKFLTKLLEACHLILADVTIINFNAQTKTDFKKNISDFESKYVFLFGVDPVELDLPILFPHFQVQAFNNITYLSSPPFGEIESDKILKSKLWVCLKKIFNI